MGGAPTPWYRAERYDLVLLGLVVSYVAASTGNRTLSASAFLVALALVALSFLGRIAVRTRRVAVWVGLAVVSVVVVVESAVVDPEDIVVGPVSVGLLMAVAAVMIGRRMFVARLSDVTAVAAAASVYLLIGFAFGNAFLVIDRVGTDPFLASGEMLTRQSSNYFSFVVLTTLGFGDLAPASNTARSFVTLEAIVGQFYLAVAVARLVSSFSASRGAPTSSDAGSPR